MNEAKRNELNNPSGYAWRDLGDGVPVMVKVCPMCGVSPSSPNDCGMPTPECPNFGKDACARERKRWGESLKHIAESAHGSTQQIENDLAHAQLQFNKCRESAVNATLAGDGFYEHNEASYWKGRRDALRNLMSNSV